MVRAAPAGAKIKAGDRVLGLTMIGGAMAETAVLNPDNVFPLPDNACPSRPARACCSNDLTVYFALTVRGRLAKGETVLVHGAAGGIGASTLRIAPALGASGDRGGQFEDKADVARARPGPPAWCWPTGSRTPSPNSPAAKGVDIVMDPVGGDRFTDSRRSLAPAGRLLVVGFTGGEIPTVKGESLAAQQHRRGRGRLGSLDDDAPEFPCGSGGRPGRAAVLRCAGRPATDVFPLERAAGPVASLENRTARGKVVVRVR